MKILLKNLVESILCENSIIDAEARKKGYNIKNIYHGTSNKFTKFDLSAAKNVDAKDTDGVIYASDDEQEARYAGHPDSKKSIVMKLYGKLNKPFIVDAMGTEKNRSFGAIGYKKLIQMAKNKGHDGIIIKNIIDFGDTPQTTYVFFDINSVKFAEETYDDDGRLIPIDKRFDSSNPDMRF